MADNYSRKAWESFLQRCIRNECTEEEVAEVQQLLKENPELLQKLFPEQEWSETPFPLYFPDDISLKLQRQIETNTDTSLNLRKHKYLWIAAATLLAVILTTVLVFRLGKELPAALAVTGKEQKDSVIRNDAGRSRQIRLSDSSIVTLGPGSCLILPVPFHQKDRTLRLEGEAIFAVARNRNWPFTVLAGQTATTAIGTRFRIRNLSGQKKIFIQLLEGKVVVQKMPALAGFVPVYLKPGEELVYNKANADRKIRDISISNLKNISGKTQPGSLDFDNMALDKVLGRLGRKYNTTIKFDSKSMSNILFTGHFEDNDQLGSILQVISALNNLEVQETGTEYTVTAKKE